MPLISYLASRAAQAINKITLLSITHSQHYKANLTWKFKNEFLVFELVHIFPYSYFQQFSTYTSCKSEQPAICFTQK